MFCIWRYNTRGKRRRRYKNNGKKWKENIDKQQKQEYNGKRINYLGGRNMLNIKFRNYKENKIMKNNPISMVLYN